MTHPAFDTWRQYMGEIIPGGGDYEDFTEEVFRVYAAIQSFGAENTWIHHQWGSKKGWAFNALTGEKRPADDFKRDGAGIYGMQPNLAIGHGMTGDAADDYALFKSFQRNAGRYTEVGGFCSETEGDFERIFERMYSRGIREAILKRRHNKYPLMGVDLDLWKFSNSIFSAIKDSDASWSLINDEGKPTAYLVQERVTMRYEYRTFIVGGRPVTGAGCVEEFTPLNNSGEAFDDTLREFRGQHSTPERLPEVRDALLEFATRVAAEIALEVPQIGGYTLDTALDQNGNPLVIELNGHTNAGFYASQPQKITDALYKS
jgi:hypothetical protein